jgi:hypothetical protein
VTFFLLVVLIAIATLILATTDRGRHFLHRVVIFSGWSLAWASGAATLGGIVCVGITIGGWVAIFVPLVLVALVIASLLGFR